MKSIFQRSVPLTLSILMATLQLTACGDANQIDGSDTSTKEDTTEQTEAYSYSDQYAGETINVLNIQNIFSMHAVIDTRETNGDTLNDAQYNAVRKLEDKTGVVWKETNVDLQTEFQSLIPQLILSGDNQYDIIYENARDLNAFASQGYYYNLLDYPQIMLHENWWLTSYNNNNVINGKLFTALGYSNLTVVDSIGCLIFNESMMEDNHMELPYDYVRNGTWTLDVLGTYIKKAATLNGDSAFEWKDDGSCIWGITMASNAGAQWLRCCGEHNVIFDNGELKLTAGTERFYNACVKIANMLGANDGSIYYGHYYGDDEPGSYINCFEVERAMFGTSQIAKTNRMRNSDYTYGVVPYPKLDEQQERYYVTVAYPASGISIPVTCNTPERSVEIGDAINYIYYNDVWPVFREVTLETKNLRNENSIEMLDIILNSAYPDLMTVYAIDTSFMNEVSAKLRSGDSSVASVVAAHENKLKADIDKINNQ